MSSSTTNATIGGGGAGNAGRGTMGGWFDSTLDVISGSIRGGGNSSNSRPTTPVPAQRQRACSTGNMVSSGGVNSAPSSPIIMRGLGSAFGSGTGEQQRAFGLIHRLPSQDSLDQSIHNDSTHGGGQNKKASQVIQNLKQSNARLTARTAAMEADFMNQLQQQTRSKLELEEKLKSTQTVVATLEQRCRNAESRIREKDSCVQKIREESAFQRHTISDLRTQLQQVETELEQIKKNKDRGGVGNGDGGDAAALEEELGRVRAENERLKKEQERQAASIGSGGGHVNSQQQFEQTREALYRSETALAGVQRENERLQRHHEIEIDTLRESMDQQLADRDQVIADLKRKLEEVRMTNAEDVAAVAEVSIQELREKVLEYSGQLTALTTELTQVKADAERQDMYRREEVEDLRVLNDAQEDEIESLRKQLEETAKELELREQEVHDLQQQSTTASSAELDETTRNEIEALKSQLSESEETRVEEAERFEETLRQLRSERDALKEAVANAETAAAASDKVSDEVNKKRLGSDDEVAKLKATVESLEARCEEAERLLSEAKESVAALEKSKSEVVSDYESKLRVLESQFADLEVEVRLLRLKKPSPSQKSSSEATAAASSAGSTGESTTDSNYTSSPGRSVGSKQQQQQQSGGAAEDELRKQLDKTRKDASMQKKDLQLRLEKKEREALELQNKLEDRDTTISALVKSSVTLEEKLASYKIEVDALRNKLSSSGYGDNGSEAGCDVILAETVCTEEMKNLRIEIEELHEMEKLLVDENARLQDQVREAHKESAHIRNKLESARAENLVIRTQLENATEIAGAAQCDTNSQTGSNAGSSTFSASPQLQIQERDNAIANLVSQSIEQDKLVSDLRDRLAEMTVEVELLRSEARSLGVGGGEANVSRSISAGSLGNNSSATPSWEEVQELRKEAEMFAGQVIEQDEEIELLKQALRSREDQLISLEKELADFKRASVPPPPQQQQSQPLDEDKDRIMQLSAEIDEMTEANAELLDELRILRRKSDQFEQSAQEIDRLKREIQDITKQSKEWEDKVQNAMREKTKALSELEQGRSKSAMEAELHRKELAAVQHEKSAQILSLEANLAVSERTIKDLRTSLDALKSLKANTVDEMEFEALRSEVEDLRRDQNHQLAAVSRARETIRELERMLAEKNSNEAAAWDEEKEELIGEIEKLNDELEEAREELKLVEEQRELIEEFKDKIEKADDAREASEKNIVATYERKLSLLTLDKDVTLDKLRKELAQTKEDSAAEIEHVTTELNECEAEMDALRQEFACELRDRDSQIVALQHTLEAQEQLANNMKTEMDHLQGSMENSVQTRREEVDEMLKELVDMTTKLTQQEREMKSLQGQLHDKQVHYEAEIKKLKETIELMESEDSGDRRTAEDLRMEIAVREVKDRLEKLRWRNTSLSEENEELRERLVKAERRVLERSADSDRLSEMQQDLEQQNEVIRGLKLQLTRLKSPPATGRASPSVASGSESTSSSSSTGGGSSSKDNNIINKPPPVPVTPSPTPTASRPATPSTKGKIKPPSAKPSPRRLGFLGRRQKPAE